MPLIKSFALVLCARRFSESSKIVTLFTQELGRVSCMAKGVLRPRSCLGPVLEPLVHCQIQFTHKKSRELHTLTSADIIDFFHSLRKDLAAYGRACAAAELLERYSPPEQPHQALYHLALAFFRHLETVSGAPELRLDQAFWLFLMRFMKFSGFKMVLDRCASCRKTDLGLVAFLAFDLGGLICGRCSSVNHRQTVTLSPVVGGLLRQLQSVKLEKLKCPPFNRLQAQGITSLLTSFIQYHFHDPRPLKTIGSSLGKNVF